MEKLKHTFVISAHDESPYIEECILSLRRQTVKSALAVSTSTPSVFLERLCEKYRIPVIISGAHNGIASDWSFAYGACATKYVTLAHQDDLYMPEYTESCLAAAEKRGNRSLIVFTGYDELYGDEIVSLNPRLFVKRILLLAFLFRRDISSVFIKKGILSFGNPISCPSVMYNKGVIGDFKFSDSFDCNMDWDAWLRLSRREGSFVYVNKKLVLHRMHKDSQTSRHINDRIREKEDAGIFNGLWPGPIAKLLAGVYSFAARTAESRRES